MLASILQFSVNYMDERCEITATNDWKYLDPSQILTTRCISGRKSFSIDAPRGQNIKMTCELLYQNEKNQEVGKSEEICDREIGTIKYDNKDNMTICNNGFARDRESAVKNVFISHSDHIYVTFMQKLPKSNLFLQKIEGKTKAPS